MNIFQEKVYLIPHLVILKPSDQAFLFVGNLPPKMKSLVLKLQKNLGDINSLSSSETLELGSLYGKNLKDLGRKLRKPVELKFHTIHSFDNILTLKKKIFIYLSKGNLIFHPDNQYLYIKHKIDNRFFLEILENIYLKVNSLSKKEVKAELSKILDKKINLTKKIYLKNNLKNLILENTKERTGNSTYDIPLNFHFHHKSNDLMICEYADPFKNQDIENIQMDKIDSLDYKLLHSFQCDNTYYLIDRIQFKELDKHSEYLEQRYWPSPMKKISSIQFDKEKKELEKIFQSLDDKLEKLNISHQMELQQKIVDKNLGDYDEICANKITSVSFLFQPNINFEINLVKLFDLFKVDRTIPYVNYIADKRKQSKIKIYEPAYYGDQVDISELLLKKWREEQLSNEEQNYLTKKFYLVIKCKFKKLYLTFKVSKFGTVIVSLSSINMMKKNLFNINLGEIIDTINEQIIQKINKTLGVRSGNKMESIKQKYIQVLQLSGQKEVKLAQSHNVNILHSLVHHYHEFIYLKFKQSVDDIELGLKKRKNNYGLKINEDFGSLSHIEQYISQLIIEFNNELSGSDIENKIQSSFNISKTETQEIYGNLLKSIQDAQVDSDDPDKFNPIALLRKNLKGTKDNISFQYYLVGDILRINFAFIKNEKELIIFNNLIDHIIKEYLLEKKYQVNQNDTKIKAQEKKLEKVFETQVSVVEDAFAEKPKPGLLLDNSSDNNSDSNNNSVPEVEVEEEESPKELENNVPEEVFNPVLDLEYDNLKEYFTEMRAKYDPELFISKRKTKDKLITDKKEEAKIKYTTRCQSVNDKFPIIISKNKLKVIQNNPKYLEGLDVFGYQELDKKTGEITKETATFYILGGSKNKNVYICPRIWCVRCEIPISPVDFVKKQVCIQCGGKVLKDKKEKITEQKTLYVRKHPYTWKDTKKTSHLNRFLNEVIKGSYQKNSELEDLVIQELKMSQKSMYPYYLKPQKIDKNIALTCCGSKSLPVEDESGEGDKVKQIKGETIYYFLNKKDVLEQDKLGFITENLALILGNEEEKKSRKQFKYYFRHLGQTYIYNDFFNQRNKFFRLGVESSIKNGILSCFNSLLHLLNKFKNPEAPYQNYVEGILQNPEIYKPSLFIRLINGNAVELFRNKLSINEYLNQDDIPDKMSMIQNFKDWIQLYQKDLKHLGIPIGNSFNYGRLLENSNIYQLWNIFTGFQEFQKYMLDPEVAKNMEYVWDFFSMEGIVEEKGINIIIMDVNTDQKETQYSLLCPKYYSGQDFYFQNRNTVILLKYDKSYELVAQIKFKFNLREMEDVNPLLPYANIKNVGGENLLKLMIHKCSQLEEGKHIVRIHQLESVLDKLNLNSDFEIQKYIRGKYPKIIGVILKNGLYLPVFPESIKSKMLGQINGIQDLKRTQVLSLEKFLTLKKKLESQHKLFQYLDIKHIFNDDRGLAFIRLEGQNLIPIQKVLNFDILNKYYSEEKVRHIRTGIHESQGEQKLDEFSIDDLIFDQQVPDDERIEYIKKYHNNEREFKNIILGINSFMVSESNRNLGLELIKIIINEVYPVKKKRKELQKLFLENKIFAQLFYFTENKYFKKKVPIISCYGNTHSSHCYQDGKEYKIRISKKNLVNGMDNEKLFLKLIIEEIIRDPKYGKNLVSKKIEDYELKSLGSLEKRDQIIFGADSLERIFHRLYSKRKVKFLRDIDNIDSRKEFQDIDYGSLEPGLESLRIVAEPNIKTQIELKPKKTKKNRKIKIKRERLTASPVQDSNLKVKAGKKNMFGVEDTDSKVSEGECIFPFNMTTRGVIDGKKTSRPYLEYHDCVLSKEGPYCATQVKRTKKAVRGKLKKLAEYQETEKHASKKGYCAWESFFQRELQGRLKGKVKNPNCVDEYKIFKDNPQDGNKKLVDIKGCMPDQVDSIDVENPRYVCPDKSELKKGGIFYKSKHKQLDCFL